MTVCIAAFYNEGIIAVTDTKRTVGERSHEPSMSKIVPLTNNVFALVADDLILQSELCQKTVRQLREKFPNGQCKVSEAVQVYNEAYMAAKQDRILKNILADYGYKAYEEYTSKPPRKGIDKEITRRMEAFTMPGRIETIIAGIDERGRELWLITPEDQLCCSDEGFVSIGQGVKEVEYQFHKLEYERNVSLGEVLFIAYVAKARAEDFLGVGFTTAISHLDKDGFKIIAPFALLELYKLYDAVETGIKDTERFGKQLVGESQNMPEPKETRSRPQGRTAPKKETNTESSLTEKAFLENLKKASRKISERESEKKETSD